MAMFGDNGTETAIFVPHAETGTQILESIGVMPASKVAAGQKVSKSTNPETGVIEEHTAEEWKELRLEHASRAKKESLSKKALAKPKPTEREIEAGGVSFGSVTTEGSGALSVAKDVGTLKEAAWKKVVAEITKAITAAHTESFDLKATQIFASEAHKDPHSKRLAALAGSSITAAAKGIEQITKEAPASRAAATDQSALAGLYKLIDDAKRSANKQLVAGLDKMVESTATAYAKVLGDRAAAKLAPIESRGKLKEIQAKIALANRNAGLGVGSKVEEGSDEGIEHAKLAQADATQEALEGGATALLNAEKEAKKKHHPAVVAAVQKELEQVATALGESKLNTATIKAEYEKSVREQVQKTVTEAVEAFSTTGNVAATHLQEAEAVAKNAGTTVGLGTFRANVGEQIAAKRGELGADKGNLGEAGKSAAENHSLEEKIASATLAIVQLEGSVQEQVKATIAAMDAEAEGREGLKSAQITGAEIGEQLAGTNLAGYEEDASKQSGLLTPQQVAGANEAEARFREHREAEEREKEAQRTNDERELAANRGTMSQSEVTAEETKIQNITNAIGTLAEAIQGNVKATEKLEETTKENSKVMTTFTGSVTFQYQSQTYSVGGQTSDLLNTPGVGG
jgi:hypothetical protein